MREASRNPLLEVSEEAVEVETNKYGMLAKAKGIQGCSSTYSSRHPLVLPTKSCCYAILPEAIRGNISSVYATLLPDYTSQYSCKKRKKFSYTHLLSLI